MSETFVSEICRNKLIIRKGRLHFIYLGELDLHQQSMLTSAASSPAPGVLGTRGSDGARWRTTDTCRDGSTSVDSGGDQSETGEQLS